MKFWQCLSTLIITILISACATTSNDKFSYTTEKRPLNSDFELAMSLLNRPVPQDQQFMLAFAQQQENQWDSMHYVSIYEIKRVIL